MVLALGTPHRMSVVDESKANQADIHLLTIIRLKSSEEPVGGTLKTFDMS
jgi:hypothetical protein